MRIRLETSEASGITSLKLFASEDSTFSAVGDSIAGEISELPESFATRQFTFSDLNIELPDGGTYIFVAATLSTSASGSVEVILEDNSALGLLAGTIAGVNGESGSIRSLSMSGEALPLPVEMTSFSAVWGREDRVRLTWSTASETNNTGFYVQRRRVERPWKELGFVEGAGTSTVEQTYQYDDGQPPYASDSLFYRLKQVDVNGATTLSDEIVVAPREVERFELLDVYPNPASHSVTLRYAIPGRKRAQIIVYDGLGRRVQNVLDTRVEGRSQTTLDVSGFSSGVYFLQVRVGAQLKTKKITVVR
jgi:hypothetical protein